MTLAEAEDESFSIKDNQTHPYGMFVLLAVLVAIFFCQLSFRSPDDVADSYISPLSHFNLIDDGGLIKSFVDMGQWWRFFCAPLLHQSLLHLSGNALGLVFGGYILERLIGWRWCGAIFAFSALAGGVLSYSFNPADTVSVGASGGICGLFGAALVVAIDYPTGSSRKEMIFAALRILVPTLFPHGHNIAQIDIAAHFGGTFGGAFLAAVLLISWKDKESLPKSRILPVIMTAAFTLCAVISFYDAIQFRSAAIKFQAVIEAHAPGLPSSFDVLIRQSAMLIKSYPRDPRIKYARAVDLYNQDHNAEAQALLESTLEDRDILALTPSIEAPARSLLGTIYEADGHHDLAKTVVAPICGTSDKAVKDLINDLCK